VRVHTAQFASHVAFLLFPWTARELAASAAPTVHAGAIYTEVLVVAVHLDEVPECVCLAHEVARIATDGLSGILHAHVALGLYMLGIATQTHIEQRAADDRTVVALLRSLSNVFKLSVLHHQRHRELAQLRVEGKLRSRVQHSSAPQAFTEAAGVYTWTVEHVSYVRTTQNVSKALLLLAGVRLLCLARVIAVFHGELCLALYQRPVQELVLQGSSAEVVCDVFDQSLGAARVVGQASALQRQLHLCLHVRGGEKHKVLHQRQTQHVGVVQTEQVDVSQAAARHELREEAEDLSQDAPRGLFGFCRVKSETRQCHHLYHVPQHDARIASSDCCA